MAIFEEESADFQNRNYRQHLDRNWKNGNDGFDAVNKRIESMGTIFGDGNIDNQSVLIDANGKKWGSLSGRLDNDQTTGETALDLVQSKADKNYVESYLKQISFVPETFSKLEDLKKAYPNGKAGIFIVADTGHKYIWANNEWTDSGAYQSTGIAERSIVPDQLAALSLGLPIFQVEDPVKFDTINRTLTFPAGNMIINGRRVVFDAQTVYYEDPEGSGNLMIYYNLANQTFTHYWATTQYYVDKNNEVFVCHANPINHTLWINAPSIVNGRGVLYEPTEFFTPLVVKGTATVIIDNNGNGTYKVTVKKWAEISIGGNRYWNDNDVVMSFDPKDGGNDEGGYNYFYLYFSITDKTFILANRKELDNRTLTGGSILVDKFDVKNGESSNPNIDYYFGETKVTNVPDYTSSSIITFSPQPVVVEVNDELVNFTIPFDFEVNYGSKHYYQKSATTISIKNDASFNELGLYFNLDKEELFLNWHYSREPVPKRSILLDLVYVKGNVRATGNIPYTINGKYVSYSRDQADNTLSNVSGTRWGKQNWFANKYRTVAYSHLSKAGSNDLSLGIITDIHFASNSYVYNQRGESALSHIHNFNEVTGMAGTDINLNLGDLTNGASDIQDQIGDIAMSSNELQKGTRTLLSVRGNHDNNVYYAKKNGSEQLITNNQLYAIYEKRNELLYTSQPERKEIGAYSYVNKSKKIVVLALNSFDFKEDLSNSAAWDYAGYGSEQMRWIAATLNSVPEDYHVIVITHDSPNEQDGTKGQPNYAALRQLLESFQNSDKSTISETEVGTITPDYYKLGIDVDFSNKPQGRLIAVFSGHWHWDRTEFINGVRYITIAASASDEKSAETPRTRDTFVEDCFDLMAINYANRTIKSTRFGGGEDHEVKF